MIWAICKNKQVPDSLDTERTKKVHEITNSA